MNASVAQGLGLAFVRTRSTGNPHHKPQTKRTPSTTIALILAAAITRRNARRAHHKCRLHLGTRESVTKRVCRVNHSTGRTTMICTSPRAQGGAAYLVHGRNAPGVEQNALRQRCLATVNVCTDANVANALNRHNDSRLGRGCRLRIRPHAL